MANIMSASYRFVKSSPFERVRMIQSERNAAIRAHQNSYNRSVVAWKMYFSLAGDQWPDKELAQLNEEQRRAYQYNILTPKVNTMAGAIITDLPDLNWRPIEGQKTTGTEAIKDTWYSDKELCDWESNLISLIRGGLVHGSWAELVETKKYHPLGNIGLEYIREGGFTPEAYWKTDNDRDLKKGWKSCYFTAEGIKFKYDVSSPQIDEAVYRRQDKGSQELSPNAPEERLRHLGKVGDEYEVIEEMWLEIKKTKRLIGRREGETTTIPFPVTEDQQKLEAFANANQIDWSSVQDVPYEDIISHKTAVAPALDPRKILCDTKTRVQVKGLPVFHFTTQRHNGRDKGLAEQIIDAQITVNKRISLQTELIEKANGGSRLINKNLFMGDERKEREFLFKANKPGYKSFADLDEVKTPFVDMSPAAYPSNLMAQLEMMFNTILPAVSMVSDAWSAESASEDSGILYERKIQMNKIGTLILDKRVRQLMNNLGEAYFYQWQITYGDQEREIGTKGGKDKVVLNERLENGSVKNSVSYIPRCRVIVSEDVQAPTKKIRDRSIAVEALKNTNPETNPLTYLNFNLMFIKSLDYDEDDMAEFLEGCELEKAVAKTGLYARIAQATAGTSAAAVQDQQAQMQLSQMGQQGGPQPQPPQEQITSPEEQVNPVPQEEMQEENTVSEQLL